MCGRYRLSRRKQVVEEYFDTVAGEEDWTPRYNIAPSQPIPVIRQNPKEPVRGLSLMRWGLVPSWAKDPLVAAKNFPPLPAGRLCHHAAGSHRRRDPDGREDFLVVGLRNQRIMLGLLRLRFFSGNNHDR